MIPLPLWFWTFFALFIVFLFLCFYLPTKKFNYWKKRNVTYIKPYPLVGSLLPLMSRKLLLGEWLRDLCRDIKKPYFGIFVFSEPVLVIQCPKMIKNILQKDFSHFQNRSADTQDKDPIMHNMMFFSENPKWKEVRSILSPVFSTGKLRQMFPFVLKESEKMIEYIHNNANLPELESKEICGKYSTNVMAKCVFSVDAKCFENENAEFRLVSREIFNDRTTNCLRQMMTLLAPKVTNFFNVTFIEPYTIKKLCTIFRTIVNIRSRADNVGSDLIGIFLGAKNNRAKSSKIDDDVVMGQAIQFFTAGFETVSIIISFTLYELCLQPEIQETLRLEVLDNIKRHNGLTYEGLSDMIYLDMCIAETLRKYPVLQYLDRVCLSDYKVEGTDLTIEKGIAVYIPMFGLHYDPTVFPDPDKYDPERFRQKSKINQNGLYYIPFGEGPRSCIGNRFGLLGVKIGLASIMSKFKVETSENTPIPIKYVVKSFLPRSKGGIPLKFVSLN